MSISKSRIINQKSTISLLAPLLLALALFVPLFLTTGVGPFDFWWWIAANLLVLLILVQFVDAEWRAALIADLQDHPGRKVLAGILSALVLYGIFWLGDKVSRFLLAGAAGDIAAVYDFKGQASALRIALLMLLVIGPGEELFWRGFLQRRLTDHLGGPAGWLVATALYTSIHIVTGNPILILAAGVCGLFWGWLYWKYRSLLLNVVSHTTWDLAIFLLLPLH